MLITAGRIARNMGLLLLAACAGSVEFGPPLGDNAGGGNTTTGGHPSGVGHGGAGVGGAGHGGAGVGGNGGFATGVGGVVTDATGVGGVVTDATGVGGFTNSTGFGGFASSSGFVSSTGFGGSVVSGSSSFVASSGNVTASASSSGVTSSGAGAGPCAVAGTPAYPAEIETNDSTSHPNILPGGASGFSGSICPAGDVDVYELSVAGGGSIAASLSNGAGSCVATSMRGRLLDATGAQLAQRTGKCSLFDPTSDPSLSNLPGGSYFVELDKPNGTQIPFYQATITTQSAFCGDGVVQANAGEQCDDGNTTSGDGCSSTCKLEQGAYRQETEVNDTIGTANSVDGYAGAVGVVSSNSSDVFSFTVTVPGSSVFAQVSDGLGNCDGYLYDASLALLGPTGSTLATSYSGGVGGCPALFAPQNKQAANLAPGTYYIRIDLYDSVNQSYVLDVKVRPPGCGDAILQPGEQCDDGNTVGGDGCSASCTLEKPFLPEVEPNNSSSTANALGSAPGFFAQINPVGDQDHFTFDVTVPGSSVTIAVTDGIGHCPYDLQSKITLYNPAQLFIAQDTNGGNGCPLLSPATSPATMNLAVGTYEVVVNEQGNNATGAYVLEISVKPPGCGDGILQAGEQCDDGNTVSGDGCSATCQAEPGHEIEPNDSIATATPQWPGYGYWTGSISPAGDHDYFSFVVPAGATVVLQTHDVGNPSTCAFDSLIHLYNPAGAGIANNDDGGIDGCSKITRTNLAPGTYYVMVEEYSSGSIPAYQLDVTIQ